MSPHALALKSSRPEAPEQASRAEVRPRTAKMDRLVKQVSSSPRFSFESAAAAVSKATAKAKAKA